MVGFYLLHTGLKHGVPIGSFRLREGLTAFRLFTLLTIFAHSHRAKARSAPRFFCIALESSCHYDHLLLHIHGAIWQKILDPDDVNADAGFFSPVGSSIPLKEALGGE